MAAILGLATAAVEAACHEVSRQGSVAVAANLNAPDQTVISGDPDAVARAGEACKTRGAKRVIPLKVSGAFHSPLMAPAKNHLQMALEKAPFQDPAFPVIANATAEAVKDTGRARRLLADQLTAPVRWVECMQHAARLAGEGTEVRWVEIGPGQVLAGLLKRIVPGANVVSLGTAAEVAKYREAA
jgi:[acyl-carrier-protein] S-malonyltransferase